MISIYKISKVHILAVISIYKTETTEIARKMNIKCDFTGCLRQKTKKTGKGKSQFKAGQGRPSPPGLGIFFFKKRTVKCTFIFKTRIV